MSVSKNALLQLALETYRAERDSACLDKADLARLQTAERTCGDNRSFQGYGPLATPIGDREATDAMIEWFAHTVARFAPARHLGSPLIRPEAVFFNSHAVGVALQEYVRAGSPASGYQVPSFNDFLQCDSLARIHEKLGLGGLARGPDLTSVDHWRFIAFVLHGESHWSVVVFIRMNADQRFLMHYDSILGLHAERAIKLTEMLHASGLVPLSVNLQRPRAVAEQRGAWQCGYAIMARFYDMNCRASNSVPYTADQIIADTDGQLRSFLRFAIAQNAQAAALTVLDHRWRRIWRPSPASEE